jgi:hypothetical protein
MDGTGDLCAKENKPDSERQTPHFLSYAESRSEKNDKNVERGQFGEVARGEGKGEGVGGEYDQSTLHASMKIE